MEHQDVKKKFEKLEKFLKPFYENNEQPNKIERELIRVYMLELYESLLPWMNDDSAAAGAYPKPGIKEPVQVQKVEREISVVKGYVGSSQISGADTTQQINSTTDREIPVVVRQPEINQEPAVVDAPEVITRPVVEAPKVVEQPITESPVVEAKIAESVQSVGVASSVAQVVVIKRYDEIFQINLGKEISDKLANLPLKSLKGAIGINDKILLVNELFKGDMGKYNDLIDRLDRLASFSEAKEVLSSEIIPVYHWDEESRLDKAKSFVQLINRRYLN